ncbi:2-succinyl-6-hydroxy-2,4-cyclohexadiene-1-carboxylate synthase [Arenibacter antarcticus]|uniref:Prolyl oligopeptidase family serine peptidase n=1 Tax=Arenibacter antarcticus TaxID=2040469 RepID=A0ABW5VK63_9FLAO|nr:prolyl oligopeptidase family serine peptidase [Arenibacter sp. H213]MCM4167284.1 alpha/beta hydrolase [Arenibacter sp. H213]
MKLNIFIFFSLFVLTGCASQSSPELTNSKMEVTTTETLKYYLYYPENYKSSGDEKFPLLLFLHGGGESGGSLDAVKRNGPPKLLTGGKKFPFLILAPQNPNEKMWWNTRAVNQLLETVIAENKVDPNRIYLTGLSRGGGAAWEMAVQYPDKFAALAVVCGMAPLPYASWINKKLPIWVFHGDQDNSIPISESVNMVAKLREMGYRVQFTIYKGVGHNAWEKAYENETLYDWFMEQEKLN